MLPLLFFCLFFFFLKYAEAVRQSQVCLSSREFTGWGLWRLREFNELPHQLSARLSLAAQAADSYLSLHPRSPTLYQLTLTFKYITGALLAVCLLLYICEDAPLLAGKIGGRGLLGSTFLLGILYALLSQGGPPSRGPPTELRFTPTTSSQGGGGTLDEDSSGVSVSKSSAKLSERSPSGQSSLAVWKFRV